MDSTAGKNLAYTLAVNTQNILCSDFIFNYYTAIVVRDFLANLTDNDVKIKWPNDIILKGKKIVGILIEKKKLIKIIISLSEPDSIFFRKNLMKFPMQDRF
jgi:biotin-(acetyl-CoA carboxylase) ligase